MTLLEKTQGAVGCGHCRKLGATLTCPSCGKAVCEACARRWESCPEPAARELRLGMGRRLRAVDEAGQLGLVSSMSSFRLRLLDLQAPAWIDRPCPRHPQRPWPLLHGARAVQIQPLLSRGGNWSEVQVHELWPDGAVNPVTVPPSTQPPRIFRSCREPELCLLVTDREAAEVIDLARCLVVASVGDQGHVIHAVEASAELDLLALGGYRRLSLYRLGGGRSPLARLASVGRDNVIWIGLSRVRLALIDDSGALEVYHLDPHRGSLGERSYEARAPVKDHQRADLEPSGRLLATASGRVVTVHDLAAGEAPQRLEAHTDTVNLVRFVRGGQLLVTADQDNRVILWPRRGERVVEQLLPAAGRLPTRPFDEATRVELAPCAAASLGDG